MCCLESVSDRSQIGVVVSMGMPYLKHRGSEGGAVGLHVAPEYGSAMRASFPFKAVRCVRGVLALGP